MNVVSINGVEYVKAADIAKQFRYTADYVGQLCRARKVDAKLVGRTWYVSERSLLEHKNGRHAVLRSDEKIKVRKAESETSWIAISRPLDKKTLRSLPPLDRTSHFARHIEWKPVKYETDDTDLLPPLHEPEPVSIPVDLAEATTVAVRGQERPMNLVADPLPEVALRGTLTIGSLDDNFETSEENIAISDKNEVMSTEPEVSTRAVAVGETKQASRKITRKKKDDAFTYGVEVREVKTPMHENSSPVPAVSPSLPSFTPARLRHPESTVAALQATKGESGSTSVLLYSLLGVVFIVAIASLIGLDFAIEATGTEFTRGLSLTPLSTLEF